jgi:hypothetical protein
MTENDLDTSAADIFGAIFHFFLKSIFLDFNHR